MSRRTAIYDVPESLRASMSEEQKAVLPPMHAATPDGKQRRDTSLGTSAAQSGAKRVL